MLQITVTLTFNILTQTSIGIIYGSWPFMIQRKVNIGEISLKLISGQDFANDRGEYRRTDGQTDGQMDDMRHNKGQKPNVPSGIKNVLRIKTLK